eukprot:gene652-721_t
MILRLCERGEVKKLISSSGGNAGHSVATVGESLGLPVDVYVPVTTNAMMIGKIKKKGANVFVGGENWNAADEIARTAVKTEDSAYYIPPYDNELIWDGHSSIVDEIETVGLKPDRIVLSVGGGGLLCGVQRGLERLGWTSTTIIAVETEGAASFAAAQSAGHPVRLSKIDTVASSLGALSVTAAALQSKVRTESLVVTDAEAVAACIRFANENRSLVEPACGASLAAVYEDIHWRRIAPSGDEVVVVIVCGGSVVSLDLLQTWREKYIV